MAQDFRSPHWYRVADVRPKLAPQLRAQRQTTRGTVWYVLFDPLNQRTHRLSREAWFIVARMDGTRSVDALWSQAVAELGRAAPPQDEVIQLLSRLHEADALMSDALPDLDDLLRRRDRQRRQRWQRNLVNPLALRFSLWDPNDFLTRTLPWVRWWFRRAGLVAWLALVLPAALIALMHAGAIGRDASDMLLSAHSLIALLFVYPGVKLLHELAHAWAARDGGAEVHDMGLMFLVLAPVPYVDASGTTAFASRAARARVAAAGMAMELALAALATYVWVLVEPGFVRSLAFSVMLLAGVSTIVFNGNPLLRFDGYFVLCDAVDVPNLAQRSQRWWMAMIQRHAFGLDQTELPQVGPGEAKWLWLYAPASLVYRLVITFGIAVFLGQAYLYLGLAVGLWGFAVQFVWPLLKGLRWIAASPALVGRRARPAFVTLATVAFAAFVLLVLPAPRSSYAQGVVWPAESAQLRAQEAGFVESLAVGADDVVRAGQRVATLALDQRRADLAAAEARLGAQAARWQAALARTRNGDDPAAARVETQQAVAAREQAEHERAHAEFKLGALRIDAQRDGRLALPMAADLPGRWLKKGEAIGHVDTGEAPMVRVVVPQDDIDAVRADLQAIEVLLAGRLAQAVPAQRVREVPGGDDTLPSAALALEHGGTIAVDARDPNAPKALTRVFQFDLQLPEAARGARVGERAHVRFVHANEPLGVQGWRRLRQLLLSRLTL